MVKVAVSHKRIKSMTAGRPAVIFLRRLIASATVFSAGRLVAVSWGELLSGEGNAAEHFTGILGTAGVVAAFLAGHGVIQNRHDQLRVTLQTDNGELA